MKITFKRIRRNNIYAVVADGMEYILNAHWSDFDESLDATVTEVITGNLWCVANVSDLSEYHGTWAEIIKAYIKWSWNNE